MKNYIKAYIVSFARLVLKLGYIFPVKKHKIIFSSYEGMQYTCNPKYLFEGLFDSLDNSYEYVWVLNNPDFLPEKYRKSVKTVKYLSPTHIYHLLTSGIIISNLGIEPIIPKRASQKFINTWHGGGAYKRVSSDMNMFSKSEKYYINKMRDIRHKGTDYFLSSCERFTEVSSKDFYIDKDRFIPSGLPRNDRFFNTTDEQRTIARNAFCKKYDIPNDNLLILYAPTFRGTHRKQEHIDNQVCSQEVAEAFVQRFNKDVTFLFRSHISKDSSMSDHFDNNVKMIDMTSYPDMQDLLEFADVLVTDYSSSIWDYCITNKPGFLFVPDLKQYNSDRGFYTPIEDWPYNYAETKKQFIEKIKSFSIEDNESKISKHTQMLGSYETGNAANIVINLIINLNGEERNSLD